MAIVCLVFGVSHFSSLLHLLLLNSLSPFAKVLLGGSPLNVPAGKPRPNIMNMQKLAIRLNNLILFMLLQRREQVRIRQDVAKALFLKHSDQLHHNPKFARSNSQGQRIKELAVTDAPDTVLGGAACLPGSTWLLEAFLTGLFKNFNRTEAFRNSLDHDHDLAVVHLQAHKGCRNTCNLAAWISKRTETACLCNACLPSSHMKASSSASPFCHKSRMYRSEPSCEWGAHDAPEQSLKPINHLTISSS